MHQSGHSRAQSMHMVQFSSLRAMTPRERGGRGEISSGYWTVTAWDTMWRMVIARPLSRPVPKVVFLRRVSSLRAGSSFRRFGSDPPGELQGAGHEDVGERYRDQHLPGEALELILPQPGEGPADPDQQEDDDEGLEEEPDWAGDEAHEGEHHARVLGEGPGDDLGLGHRHVEGRAGDLGGGGGQEDEEAHRLRPDGERHGALGL